MSGMMPLWLVPDFNWDDARMVGSIASYDLTNRKLELPPKNESPWARETKPSHSDPHVNDLAGTSITRGKIAQANHLFNTRAV